MEDSNEKQIMLLSPIKLFSQVEAILNEVGAEAFYRRPDERIKSAREGLAILFYIANLAKASNKFWWVRQAQPGEQFPDFHIHMVAQNPFSFGYEGIELVEIPPRIESYEDALAIVEKKLNKGYPPGYSLLIFINNLNSTLWLPQLDRDIHSSAPFKTISTIHLLTRPGGKDIETVVLNKLRPTPVQSESMLIDGLLTTLPDIPKGLFEEVLYKGERGLRLKPELQNEMNKFLRAGIAMNREKRRRVQKDARRRK